MYFHLLSHQYLPQDIDRCLYLDVDTLVCGNIQEYYFADFQDTYIIHSMRYNMIYEKLNAIDYPTRKNISYLNSGTFVFNIAKLRENKITLSDYIEKLRNVPTRDGDQGVLYSMFGSNALIMPNKYNAVVTSKNVFDSLFECSIAHFVSSIKPWHSNAYSTKEIDVFVRNTSYMSPVYLNLISAKYYDLWHEYAAKTPISHFFRNSEQYSDLLLKYFAEVSRNLRLNLLLKVRELQIKIIENDIYRGFVINACGKDLIFYCQSSWVDESFKTSVENESLIISLSSFSVNQWLVFPFRLDLHKGKKYQFNIELLIDIKFSVPFFLVGYNCNYQTISRISTKSNEYKKFNFEFTANENYFGLAISSTNNPKLFSMSIKKISIKEVTLFLPILSET